MGCNRRRRFIRIRNNSESFGDASLGDDIESVNSSHYLQGMSEEYLLFYKGKEFTAIRQSDGFYVVLDSNYSEVATYKTLEDWYLNRVRLEYAERYGLET